MQIRWVSTSEYETKSKKLLLHNNFILKFQKYVLLQNKNSMVQITNRDFIMLIKNFIN